MRPVYLHVPCQQDQKIKNEKFGENNTNKNSEKIRPKICKGVTKLGLQATRGSGVPGGSKPDS